MDAQLAARRWADTWERAGPAKDIDAIAALYADDVNYRALVHREPDRGTDGVRDYLRRNFDVERGVECSFGTRQAVTPGPSIFARLAPFPYGLRPHRLGTKRTLRAGRRVARRGRADRGCERG